MKFNLYILLLLTILSCSKKEEKADSYYQGKMTISTDESFVSVVNALADGYMITYPEAKIVVKTQKEDLGFLDFLKGKSKLIVMSRELNKNEIQEVERSTDLPFRADKFAADAVLFVVPKNSSLNSISLQEINNELLSDDKNLVFDATNSSNLNFVAQKLNKKPSDLKFSVIDGNINVIEQLEKFPDKIGVISLNTISRPYSKEAQDLRAKIKILTIEKDGKMYSPDLKNIVDMSYPFTRVLYFLTSEGTMGMIGGFIRYSCTQLGQMIVQKEGLQKYNLYQRQVQMR